MRRRGRALKVCLASPSAVAEFEGAVTDRAEAVRITGGYPPLGILTLAAVLEQQGIVPELFDLDRLFLDFVDGSRAAPDFFSLAAAELERVEADVFGFGTLCSSYPLTVRLARQVKRTHPDSVVVFGGPQASAVDRATLEAFPFVDFVVRGEGEETFPALLAALEDPRTVPGIAFRSGGQIVCTADAPLLPDLDRLPAPAFHLWQGAGDCVELPVEAGRGCPYACTFCSTSRFFRRQFRLKSPGGVIDQMRALRSACGIGTFHLVHDAFTVVRAKAVAFCQALLDSGDRFTWTCSARTDGVDDELLSLMARAGCCGVFFGIESGSAQVQRAIGKGLDLGQASAAIRTADSHAMTTAVSLITGFPDETPEDVRCSVDFLLDSARFDHVEAQFHLLAPLAGSALYDQFRGRLQWDGLFSDMTFQGWLLQGEDRALILEHPKVFPNFYAVPAPHLDRAYLMELRNWIAYGLARFRWLMIALDQYSGSIIEVFEAWRREHGGDGRYYASADFRRDFLAFVEARYADRNDPEALAVATLLEYELGLEFAGQKPGGGLERPPHKAPGVTIVRVGADFQDVIKCLRDRRSPRDVPRRPVVLADRQLPGGPAAVIELSPLAAALLELCDGTRTFDEIAAAFPHLGEGLDRLPARPACRLALDELARQGLLAGDAELFEG